MDYIYIKKSHRETNISSVNYTRLTKYIITMEEENGLLYDPLAPFKIPREYHCFKVIDKAKAMLFCFKDSDFILKPDK